MLVPGIFKLGRVSIMLQIWHLIYIYKLYIYIYIIYIYNSKSLDVSLYQSINLYI